MSGVDALTGASVLNLMLGAGAGGLEGMALNAHQALAERGVRMLSVGAPEGWFAQAIANASEPDAFQPLPLWFRQDPTATHRLRWIARRFGADLVLAHGSQAVKLAVQAFQGRRPLAAMVHNFRAKPDLAEVDLALCVSRAVERDVSERFPGLRTKLVENFAPLITPAPRSPYAGPPRIGSIGRLHPNKGYDILIRAAARLRERGLDFRLTITGEGPERPALQAEVEALKLGGLVSLPGWVDDPETTFAAMDLFVLSSVVEPFGLVVIEAMAARTPVIASDIDGPRDILGGGRWGRLVPPRDPEALADAIAEALADPAAAEATAWSAQVEALGRYSMQAGGERLARALGLLIP